MTTKQAIALLSQDYKRWIGTGEGGGYPYEIHQDILY